MTVVGIDPGKSGAMVFLYETGEVRVFDVPLQKVKGKEVPAYVEWAQTWSNALWLAEPSRIVIEKVHAMPQQGVTSTFNFGSYFGFVLALASTVGCEVHTPSPLQWKAKIGLLGSDKNASREKARNLIPSMTSHVTRVKDDGRAEAALLAYFGRKFL